MSFFSCFFVLVFVLFRITSCDNEIACMNEDGQAVDWFVIYKLPKYKMEEKGSGVDYVYMDPVMSRWQLSKFTVNSSQGALGNTLNQLYKSYMFNSSAYALYNDAPPVLSYLKYYGHTKGALLFDHSQGFWLIHSVPHFPPFPERGYGYPSTGMLFGQFALCVTFSYGQFLQISQQLAYLNPHVYNCSLPLAFHSDMPALVQLCDDQTPALPMRRRLKKLLSANGESFLSFAKSHKYVDDIYTGWVAQTLKTSLLTETWQHTIHKLPSNCSLPNHVMNIGRVLLPGLVMFLSYDDHSKWCVSWAYEDGWTCMGDLNRSSGQIWRAGGLLCSQNPVIYKAFRNSVAWYIGC